MLDDIIESVKKDMVTQKRKKYEMLDKKDFDHYRYTTISPFAQT